jgi:hypothetical protein
MSTDDGIDLVAYSPISKLPSTIQVKANLKPKPGGGKGKEALDWWLSENSLAEFVALVDLSEARIKFSSIEVALECPLIPDFVISEYVPLLIGRPNLEVFSFR